MGNTEKCYHLHPELRPNWKKKKDNEINIIENGQETNEIKKLKLIINSLKNKSQRTERDKIPRKPSFNKMGSSVLAEEAEYQRKINQNTQELDLSSDSDSTTSENSN